MARRQGAWVAGIRGGPAGKLPVLRVHGGSREASRISATSVNPIHTSGEKCGKVRTLSKAGITVHRGFDAVDLPIRSIASRYPLLTQSRIRPNGPCKPQKRSEEHTSELQ